MIQDIYPSKFDNRFAVPEPGENDALFVFNDQGRIFAHRADDGELKLLPCRSARDGKQIYLFSIDDKRYFLSGDDPGDVPDGYETYSIRELRDSFAGNELFAAFTAYHLWKWYSSNRYCGCCGGKLSPDDKERALRCESCGNIIYPRINPAVIVGVTNGDSIIITRYKSGYAHNALIAGFCEIGETLEETVAREVMEEAGIKVSNIRYYKSQPWGMAQDLLMGFFCDADGDVTIRMDDSELKYAEWTKREDIVLQPNDLSLTNEMMRMFRDNKI